MSRSHSSASSKRIITIALSILLLTSFLALVGSGNLKATAEKSRAAEMLGESQSSASDAGQVVAASGSNRFVVWQDNTPGNDEILFKRSTDNGATWKATVNLSTNPGLSQAPKLTVQGSNVYVVWCQSSASHSETNVFFRRSTDSGASWGPKLKISTSNDACYPQIAISANYVFVT